MRVAAVFCSSECCRAQVAELGLTCSRFSCVLRFCTASRCRSCTRLELRRYHTRVTRTGRVAHVAPLSADLRAALDRRSSFAWKPHCSCVPHLAGPWPESTGVPLVNLRRAPLTPVTHLRWVSELSATTVRFMSTSTSC
jgi:hypothetical protein